MVSFTDDNSSAITLTDNAGSSNTLTDNAGSTSSLIDRGLGEGVNYRNNSTYRSILVYRGTLGSQITDNTGSSLSFTDKTE